MKQLENISLFRIVVLVLINILTRNLFIFLLTILFILVSESKESIVFLILFLLVFICSYISTDYIKYGIIDYVSQKYVIIDKGLYKVKLYSENLEKGDIISLDGKYSINSSEYEYRNNIKYVYQSNTNYEVYFKNILSNLTSKRIDELNENIKPYIKKIVLNENTYDDIKDIGYGFSFYYLIVILKRKNSKLSNAILIAYIILFGFNIKFYLLIADSVLSRFNVNSINRLSIKILMIMIINTQMLFNYSILISLLLSFYFMLNLSVDKSYLAIFQSILFSEIQLFSTFFFKYLMLIRSFLFLESIIVIVCPIISSIYLITLNIFSFIFNIVNFSIRGKLNIVSIVLYLALIKLFKFNNQFIKIGILILILITPINNPLLHVSFIDVGQGDSCLIKADKTILIDTGSKYNYSKLKKFLYSEGIYTIDYLIVSHTDEDHSGNIDSLSKNFKIVNLIDSGVDIDTNKIFLKNLNIGNYDNDNDNSLVYLLNIDDSRILFTGDISSNVENRILEYGETKNIDILKVSHHGSKSATSRKFVSYVLPRFSIISTSGQYNHPSKEVLENLESYLSKVFITKEEGSITFYYTDILDFLITGSGEFAII